MRGELVIRRARLDDPTGHRPGDLTEHRPGDLTGHRPGDLTEHRPGDLTGHRPGDLTEHRPGDPTGRRPGRVADVQIAGGRIVEIGRSLRRRAGAEELDAAGDWLIPGLHDHHIHLRAVAASWSSVKVGPPEVTNRAELAGALGHARGDGGSGWIRAVGYHESVAGVLDRDVLDVMVPDRPLRVQHRSGILWVLNSPALDLVGAAEPGSGVERDNSGRATGRLWRMDEWLAQRTASLPDRELLDRLRELSREAAAFGVTGWTDATPNRADAETEVLARAAASGVVRQRLHLMVRPGAPAVYSGLEGCNRVTTGAVKVVLDDFDLPSIDSLSREFGEAHRAGRPVAVHCVTRTQLVLTLAALAALDEAGVAGSSLGEAGGSAGVSAGGSAGGTALDEAGVVRDRIEHGAVIPPELIGQLKRLGVIVVTQPSFVAERGDEYLRSVEPEEMENLWRAGSLVRAGVSVAAGTDAPFGGRDPWAAIRAATSRRTAAGARLGRDEQVDTAEALSWWWGTGERPEVARKVRPGAVADLVVLESPGKVVATVVAGDVVHG